MLEIERLGTLISMRLLLKLGLFVAGAFFLVLVVAFGWLYFYSHDLPDVAALAQYAPTTVTQVSDQCVGTTTAIPYEAIGVNVRKAISAVEAREGGPGALRIAFLGLTGHNTGREYHFRTSRYIARSLCYAPAKDLHRELTEFRMSIQLERRYSARQLFTIYANRVPFTHGVTGVQAGSELYLHKKPADLDLSEAATLVVLVKGPAIFWEEHPDLALRYRNDILNLMLENDSITAAEALAAKAAPLSAIASENTPVM